MTDHRSLKLSSLLEKMWENYIDLNPMAGKVFKAFLASGETVVNDHIALRTFDHPKVSVDKVAKTFIDLGYTAKGDYHFKEKKLYAKHYEHSNPEQPKIFISELKYKEFSPQLIAKVDEIVEQIDADLVGTEEFFLSGRSWPLTHAEYLSLAKETEYAGWVASIGYRPNHFTVSVNHLEKLKTVQAVNQFIKEMGIALNTSGGEIKGTKADYLEQSSTMADTVKVKFTEGTFEVPSCYYEFALRYPLANGELYQGFVAKSADKIFESTNRR